MKRGIYRYESDIPHNGCGHFEGGRVEIVSCETELPAFAAWDPAEGPLSRDVSAEVPPNAKEDRNVKDEAEESGHPFLSANGACH